MRTRLVLAAGALTVVAAGAVPALASPGDSSTVGGCISGDLYGNTSNPRPSGHGVLPSQSPGPSVNNPNDPSNPVPGTSLGQGIHAAGGGSAANPGQLAGLGYCPFP